MTFDVGTFRIVNCSRERATQIQRGLYSINKNNDAGRVYASRYNYSTGDLMMWRMA